MEEIVDLARGLGADPGNFGQIGERRALDRLLINDQTVQDNPELKRSFAAYITPDGHRARLDLTQSNRMFSHDAMDQVLTLRRRH